MESMKVVGAKKPQEWTMRFGKHKGKELSVVWQEDPGYIQWIMTEPWIDQKLKSYILKQDFYDVVPKEI